MSSTPQASNPGCPVARTSVDPDEGTKAVANLSEEDELDIIDTSIIPHHCDTSKDGTITAKLLPFVPTL